jgi:hypothetical protein
METTSERIYAGLDDDRDRTVFVEYYPWICITSVWREDGRLDYFVAAL